MISKAVSAALVWELEYFMYYVPIRLFVILKNPGFAIAACFLGRQLLACMCKASWMINPEMQNILQAF